MGPVQCTVIDQLRYGLISIRFKVRHFTTIYIRRVQNNEWSLTFIIVGEIFYGMFMINIPTINRTWQLQQQQYQFNGPLSGTIQVSLYQKDKTSLDFTEDTASAGPYASLHLTPRQITTPASHHSVFLRAWCPSCRPTNSVKALKAQCRSRSYVVIQLALSYLTAAWSKCRLSKFWVLDIIDGRRTTLLLIKWRGFWFHTNSAVIQYNSLCYQYFIGIHWQTADTLIDVRLKCNFTINNNNDVGNFIIVRIEEFSLVISVENALYLNNGLC